MNTLITTNLIKLIEEDLGPGRRSGRFTKFHCPFPGHKRGDKIHSLAAFNGANNQGSWWKCYACCRHGGARAWLMGYRGMSYADTLDVLQLPRSHRFNRRAAEPPIQQPYPPPNCVWQARARILIKR